jgi:hypothetical protein
MPPCPSQEGWGVDRVSAFISAFCHDLVPEEAPSRFLVAVFFHVREEIRRIV